MDVEHPTGDRLRGKVAVITGGARGMGASHARAMVAQGARVVIADVLDDEGSEVAAALGEAATYVHLDVRDREQWRAAVDATLRRCGRIDVLVNNAGILNHGAIDDYTPEQWEQILAVNLTGVFNGIHATLGALRAAAPSSIINISSVAGLHGYASLAGYTACTFAVRGLTKSVALDLGIHGVRCNSVHPGAIATPMIEGHRVPLRCFAMRRLGRPDEVSSLVVFLASDESSFCTGAEFVVDGGEMAGLAPPAA